MTKVNELFAYLRVRRADEAIRFYERVFGAVEKMRLVEPGSGRVGHAELSLGGTTLMLSDEFPEYDLVGPESVGQTSSAIHLHVDDADLVLAEAVEHGATLVRPPTDHFYGERSGTMRDPFGHEWIVGHEIESVPPDEMQRRYDELGPVE